MTSVSGKLSRIVAVAVVLSASLTILSPAAADDCAPDVPYACCTHVGSPIDLSIPGWPPTRGDACWWYVKAQQESFATSPIGVYAKMTIERPVLASYRDHSLAEIVIANFHTDGSVDAIEVGWVVGAPGSGRYSWRSRCGVLAS